MGEGSGSWLARERHGSEELLLGGPPAFRRSALGLVSSNTTTGGDGKGALAGRFVRAAGEFAHLPAPGVGDDALAHCARLLQHRYDKNNP